MAIKVFNSEYKQKIKVTASDIKGISVDVPLDNSYDAHVFIEYSGGSTVLNGTTVHELIQATIEQNPEFRKLIRQYCDIRDDYDKNPTGFYFMHTVRKANK